MMKHYVYKTKGTCSKEIHFDTDGKTVHNVEFVLGCPGNTHGIAAIVEGMEVDKVIEKFKNINCGGKGTSCPAQLAAALEQARA